jgi:hypothetical protein
MEYTELKKQYQDKLTVLSDKVGLFWAFSNEQLKEGVAKNPSSTGKYTSTGMGGYLPSGNVKAYLAGMKELEKWYKAERKAIKKEKVILYELSNYECFYSGDITDACEALKGSYTRQEIWAVYSANRAQYA